MRLNKKNFFHSIVKDTLWESNKKKTKKVCKGAMARHHDSVSRETRDLTIYNMRESL